MGFPVSRRRWSVEPNALAALALLGWIAVPGIAGAAPPAAGGYPLLSATDTATATLVGRVIAPRRVDQHGYAAGLVLERVLSGPFVGGQEIRIAWEELAAGRPPRFADGDRILTALTPPAASIWQRRFPPTPGSDAVLLVAANGEAFVRDPDAATIDAVAAYVALSPSQRQGREGASALATLVRRASPPVAQAAVERLGELPGLDAKLDGEAAAELLRAVTERSDQPQLAAAVLNLAATRRSSVMRPGLTSLAQPESRFEAATLVAIAEIDGGLPRDSIERLLARPQPDVRAAAVRGARTAAMRPRLAALLKQDPSPLVRLAALDALVRIGGEETIEAVLPGLSDPELAVRLHAAKVLGSLGEAAVDAVVAALRTDARIDPHAAVLALDLAGPGGVQALTELASGYPDERVRHLARLVLGKAPGHEH